MATQLFGRRIHKRTCVTFCFVLSQIGVLSEMRLVFAETGVSIASTEEEPSISPECKYALDQLSQSLTYLRHFCARHGYGSDICLGMQRIFDDAWREFCSRCTKEQVPLAKECTAAPTTTRTQ